MILQKEVETFSASGRYRFHMGAFSFGAKSVFFPAVLVVLAAHRDALADDQGTGSADPALEEAFVRGFLAGQESGHSAALGISRFGQHLRLKASVDGEETGLSVECLLCSADEGLTAARSLGASAAAAASGEVRLEPGQELDMDVPAPKQRRPRFLRGAIAAAGLGLSAVATGAIFLWLDGNCASALVDAEGDCELTHDLAAAGWSVVATGIAAEAVALILLLAGGEGGAFEEDR